jgi:hypothetical protein
MTDKPMIPDLPVICMFWLGPSISYIEQLSMLSFIRAGHRVHLYAYGDIRHVPEGVVICDANTVAPYDLISTLRYPSGSYALAANYIRLLLQQQGLGVWADADMICLKPVKRSAHHLFGWESDRVINNAILYLPPDSPIIAEILDMFRPNAIPAWVGLNRKRQLWMKRLAGIAFAPQDHRFATFGPTALSYLVRKYGLLGEVEPVEVYYPLSYDDAPQPFAPDTRLEQFITERSITLHLWHNRLGELLHTRPPSTSALGRMLSDYGI